MKKNNNPFNILVGGNYIDKDGNVAPLNKSINKTKVQQDKESKKNNSGGGYTKEELKGERPGNQGFLKSLKDTLI